ncbi:MAG: BspA family leucine-rich repeat surface protein [Bacteroidota bacterium]
MSTFFYSTLLLLTHAFIAPIIHQPADPLTRKEISKEQMTNEEAPVFLNTNRPFITTWKTDNLGTSDSTSITIPTFGEGYNYEIDWENDGIYDTTGVTGSITHDYGVADTFTVAIRGDFPRIYFNNNGDRRKILTIEQWGDIQWESMSRAFSGASNLTNKAVDVPNLTQVMDMSNMFSRASIFDGDLSSWNVSKVIDMSNMFQFCSAFNGDLSSWNVSEVRDMSGMFQFCNTFDGDLNGWNVSKVTDMVGMFNGARAFNTDISGWNVSNVTNMINLFNDARAFNIDISGWNVSEVTDMRGMFKGATAFNQNINGWNVSKVMNMSEMFWGAAVFNQDLNSWDVSNVTNMYGMFRGAVLFNGDISNWDMGNVVNVISMFESARAFNQDIGSWDVSKVTAISRMFRRARIFNQDLDDWDVSKVSNLVNVFEAAQAFNGNISSWDVSNVVNMAETFYNAFAFNGDISGWDMSKVTGTFRMFNNAKTFNVDISGWDVSNVESMEEMFTGADAFNQDISDWDVSKVIRMTKMLDDTGMDVENYDALLTKWSTLSLRNDVTFGVRGLTFCNGTTARLDLMNNYNWNIIGDASYENVANAGTDTMVCNTSYNLQANMLVVGAGQWEFVDNPDNLGQIVNPTSPNAILSTSYENVNIFELDSTELQRTFQLRWEVSASCGDAADTVTITLQLPVSAGSSQLAVCGTSQQLSANPVADGTGQWQFTSNPNNSGSLNDVNDPRAILMGNFGTTYELAWQVTGGECDGMIDNVTIRFQPDSDNDQVPDCEDICPGGDDTVNSDNSGLPDDCDCSPFSPAGDSIHVTTAFLNNISEDSVAIKADDQLTADAAIGMNKTHVIFQAVTSVVLQPGFQVGNGVQFTARIDKNCSTNTFESETANIHHLKAKRTVTENLGLSIQPNLVRESASVYAALKAAQPITLQLFNQNGQLVQTLLNRVPQAAGTHEYRLEVGTLPSGLYFVRMQGATSVVTKRLVVVK